jgi:O-antigen biosynthesis protein
VTRAVHSGHGGSAGPADSQGAAIGPAADPGDDAATVVAASPFFDADWYAEVARCRAEPLVAARHYLRRGARRGLQPHPLFSAEHAVAACPALAEGDSPLEVYLRSRLFDVPTHPLFDLAWYEEHHPSARTHRWGPLGHYLEIGAREGLSPNAWYRPDPGEPRGLVDWVAARHDEWLRRRRAAPRVWTRIPPQSPAALHAGPTPGEPRVSVVVESGHDRAALERTLRSVLAQDLPARDVVVLAGQSAGELEQDLRRLFPGAPLSVVRRAGDRASGGLNLAAQRATGDYLTWARPGDVWASGRLRTLQGVCDADGAEAACDSLRLVRAGKPDLFASSAPSTAPCTGSAASPVSVDLERLLVSRTAFGDTGGFDELLPGAWEADFALRLASRFPVRSVPAVGLTRAGQPDLGAPGTPVETVDEPPLDHSRVRSWADVAFNRVAVDWDSLARRQQQPTTVTVVVTATTGWRETLSCLSRLESAGAPDGWSLECVVVDDGGDRLTSQVLSSAVHRFTGVRVLHLPSPTGSALSTNLALPEVRGSVVVLLSPSLRVAPGWLNPLVRALEQADVLAAQAVVTRPSGSIYSAGFAFPACGGLPYDFLQGFPVADAAGLDDVPVGALSRAALALRYDDLVELRGLDPLFRGGLEDVDLCLRLQQVRGGRFVVAPESRAALPRPRRSTDSAVPLLNRQLFLDRWAARAPRDDSRLWASRGFEVQGHITDGPAGADRRLCPPRPVLSRPRVSVREARPRLRWALKVASPAGDRREFWGDTHFARSLATALHAIGQQVVLDHREDFGRPSGHHDDVVLVLRGLEPFQPAYGQVSLAWVISHPELLTCREAASYDRVLAASPSWADKMARRWSIRIDPLLQATDPQLFHPDRGTTDAGEPIVFVGGSRRHYRDIVRHSVTSGLPLSVYGSDWEGLIPGHLIKGRFVPNRELGALYASAGVVLNDHWEDMRREGFLSNRLFDAVASGARVISDDVAGLAGLFDSSVQVATDAASLARLVRTGPMDHTFGGAEERRRVAGRVHREHSFDRRAVRLLDIALEIRHDHLQSADPGTSGRSGR